VEDVVVTSDIICRFADEVNYHYFWVVGPSLEEKRRVKVVWVYAQGAPLPRLRSQRGLL